MRIRYDKTLARARTSAHAARQNILITCHENLSKNMFFSIFSQFSSVEIARANARAHVFWSRIYFPNIVKGSKTLNE
eukprot:UN19327